MKRTPKIVFWIVMPLLAWLFIYFTVTGDLLMALLTATLLGLVGGILIIFWED